LEGVANSRGALLKRRDAVLQELADNLGVTSLSMENVRSPKWLERAHDSQKLSYPRTAKTGQGSFTKDWMRGHVHWLPRLVSRADQLTEAADKFLKGFILDYSHKGRIHANINQYRSESGEGTRSHRFSYSDPALQQAPERDEEIGPLFRGGFLPEPGEKWGSHDISQQEYRLIVHIAVLLNQPRAAEAAQMYREDPDTDFHQLVVEWTALDRKKAKDTNFAKSFGAGIPKFAEMIGQSQEEAARIYALYDEELPFVKGSAKMAEQMAQARGYIKLIDGARSHFDMWEPAWRDRGDGYEYPRPLATARAHWGAEKRLRRAFCHKAFNRYVQGSAARQTKLFMRECWNEGLVPLLQMHDELCFSHKEEAEGRRVAEIMRDTVKLEVPVKVDSAYGNSWGDAQHTWDDTDHG
jgi:DNA polymerase I-like protein with 3'-5' exonuclease and polymerase domains